MAVDSRAKLGRLAKALADWEYHSRLWRAAELVYNGDLDMESACNYLRVRKDNVILLVVMGLCYHEGCEAKAEQFYNDSKGTKFSNSWSLAEMTYHSGMIFDETITKKSRWQFEIEMQGEMNQKMMRQRAEEADAIGN